ncbi:MAG: ABC transporter ATP-binding protein [Clostridiaceae bacterium]|nr:ABC transporter ATP-binding protein [Clostridiaceae bacterium]
MIELIDVSFAYNKNNLVLKNITYTFNEGVLYVLSGKNGSGKTTLGKLMCGLVKTRQGVVKVRGKDIYKMTVGEISEHVGYLYQNPDLQLFAPTVYEELVFPYELNGKLTDEIKEKVEKLLKDFKLDDKRKSFPLLMSLGERQRLALATIMMRDQRFIIFDEPTASIDAECKRMIQEFIQAFVENGGGALVISHDEDFDLNGANIKSLRMEGGVLYEK